LKKNLLLSSTKEHKQNLLVRIAGKALWGMNQIFDIMRFRRTSSGNK